MTPLDPLDDVDDVLDAALPAVLLVSTSAWLPSAVLLLGYAVRVVRLALADDDALPTLSDVPSLARTGVSAAVVVVLFHLPALVVVCVAFTVGFDGPLFGDLVRPSISNPERFAGHYLTGAPLLTVFSFLLAGVALVGAGYVATAGLVTLAATDSLDSALNLDHVLPLVRSGSFRLRFLGASLIGFVGLGVAGVVALVPFVGALAGAVVELFALVIALRVVAAGSADVHHRPLRDSTTATPVSSDSEAVA